MSKRSKIDTYSISFGEDRIAEARELSGLTGLQQAEIMKALWDRYKMVVIEELLQEKGESLEEKLKDTKKLVRDLTSAMKNGS